MTSLIGVPFSGASQLRLGIAHHGLMCHLAGIIVGLDRFTLLGGGTRCLPEWETVGERLLSRPAEDEFFRDKCMRLLITLTGSCAAGVCVPDRGGD